MNTTLNDGIDKVDDKFIPLDQSVNLGEPPAGLDIPLDSYTSQDVDKMSMADRDDLSLHEALGNLTPRDIANGPPTILDDPRFPEDEHHTPVSKFLLEQISQIDAKAKQKNPNAKDVDLQTAFPKNTQSQWFVDFNQAANVSGEIGKKLLVKPNGFFFTGDEDPIKALTAFGVKEDLISDYANHFEMSYFGNTRPRTKNNNANDNGFKSYVMHLKDPTNEESLRILEEVQAARQHVIQEKLDKSYDFNKAVETLSAKAESIINEDIQNTGETPFVGSQNRLFLSPGALYGEINEKAPELKGLYSVEPLNSKGNKVTYFGYSEGLESFFKDDLAVCKIKTKDPAKLSQAELERIIGEKLELGLTNGHVAETPKDALIQQIENLSNKASEPEVKKQAVVENQQLDGEDNSPLLSEGGSKKPKKDRKEKDQDHDNDEDESHFNRRKRKEDAEAEEPDSLAKITLDALSKVTQTTLAAALALAKLVFQLLMEFIKAIGRMFGMNVGPSSLPDNPLMTFNNTLDRMRVYKGPSQDVEATKDLKPEDAVADLTEALDADIANEAKLKNEYELSEVKALDKIQLSKEALENLSIEDRARLENDADTLFNGLTDDQKQDYLKKINITTLHGFSDNLESKLSEPLVYDDRFGVLLATSDRVEFDGQDYGVVSAVVVGGELLYSVAKENESGNYDVQFVKASELTLKEHNAYSFDNLSNLKNHINEQLVEKFADHGGKIEKLAIVDSDGLQGHEISISELNNRTNFIGFEQLGFDTTPISVEELIEGDMALTNELYYSLPQLHQDKTGVLDAPSKNSSHPFFGRLLDVNDQVDGVLANGNITIRGSVIGAYESEAELYYQVMHNNQFYSVKAEDVSLVEPNGGDLTSEQISLMTAKSTQADHFRTGSIPTQHAATATVVGLLNQSDENGFNKSFQGYSHNEVIKEGGFNIGVVPLERDAEGKYLGAGQLVTIANKLGEKSSFITFGQTINPKDGMVRVVAFEVNNTLTGIRAKPAAKSRMVQLNLDDPSIQVSAAGLRNEDIKEFARQARRVYENGSMRRVANVVAHYANQAKARILGEKNEPLAMAQESYLQNKVALSLLQEKAGLSPQATSKDMGLNANLANSTFSVDQLQKIIDEPESRTHVSSQALVYANPSDLVSYSLATAPEPVANSLSVNDLIANYSPFAALSSTGVVSPTVENVEVNNSADISYQSVSLDQLSAVRVQRGFDGISVEDGKIVLQHKMENPDSVRNTMHFSLNGAVSDHAYGKFNDAGFAIVAGLNDLGHSNPLGGLSAADTWVHAKDDKVTVPNPTLIAPYGTELPQEIIDAAYDVICYPVGDSPEAVLQNRNDAISLALKDRNSPEFVVNMHNWDGVSFSAEDQQKLSQYFGADHVLANNHATSNDGELEAAFARLQHLNQLKQDGEKQYQNTNNGQWYDLGDQLDVLHHEISERINKIGDPDVKQHYIEAYDRFVGDTVLVAENALTSEIQSTEYDSVVSGVTPELDKPEFETMLVSEPPPLSQAEYEASFGNEPPPLTQAEYEASFGNKPPPLTQIDEPLLPQPDLVGDIAMEQGKNEVEVPVLPENLSSISNTEAQKLAIIASAYISGDPAHISDNQKVLNILSEKQRLAENFDLLASQAEKFDAVLRSIGLVSLDNVSTSDIGFLKDALSNDVIALHLNNLRDSVDDFTLDYAEHINSLDGHLKKVGQNIDFQSLDQDSLDVIDSINNSLRADLTEKVDGVDQVQLFVNKMDLIKQNTPDAIQALMPEIENKGPSELAQQVEKLNEVFATHVSQNSNEKTKALDADLGPSF